MPAPGRTWILCTLLAVLTPALGGCRTPFERHREALGALHEAGRYDAAEKLLTEDSTLRLYRQRNELLFRLDRGSVALAVGDHETALRQLSAAEEIMDRRRSLTVGEALGSLLLNDTVRPYLGEPYEDMYLNVFKLLAQLEAGNIVGGASVEARRMALKANQLRDEYLRLAPRVFERGDVEPERLPEQVGGYVNVNAQGEFIESPLGVFLTVVAFMHAGEPENQRVAARRLLEGVRLQEGLIGPVDGANFEGLADLRPEQGNALFVAFSGRGPRKEARSFPPLIIASAPIYFELPVLRATTSQAASARVVVGPPGSSESTAWRLDLVEDLSRVAAENHRRQLPIVYARTIARAIAKGVGVAVATHATQQSRGDATATAALLGGLLLVLATERADLRCWEFLPGQAHVSLLSLPPGEHTARVEWLSPGGSVVYASRERVIRVPPAGESPSLVTMIEFFPR